MVRATQVKEPEPEPQLNLPDLPPDPRVTDPTYGSDNSFVPIEEGQPNVTYYMLKANLMIPIPKELVSQKTRRGRDGNNVYIDYVNITDLKDLLDERVGLWTATVKEYKQIGDELCVVVTISIFASDGRFDVDGTGTERANHMGFGDTFSNAYAQGFRRACEGHGMGRELWRKTDVDTEEDTSEKPEHTQERPQMDPVAKNLADMITAKQLGLIRSIGKESKIEVDEECTRLFNCSIGELSKRAASDLIEHLSTKARQTNGQAPATAAAVSTHSGPQDPTDKFMNSSVNTDSGPPATGKQKDYIKNVCSDRGLNEELIALDLFKNDFENITKVQASKMIEHLIGKK